MPQHSICDLAHWQSTHYDRNPKRIVRKVGYKHQKKKEDSDRPPLIAFGHNKDHRPDLKQLVYSLAVTADGAVPVHYKTYDGNTSDDKTHI